jgi:DNA-binding Lrp family transcriptional regulator
VIPDIIEGLDRQILQGLQIDGRVSFAHLAHVLEVSDQTVARRWRALRERHGVRVVGVVNPHVAGDVPWIVRVRCAPDAAIPVAEALARRDDTRWVHLVAGGTEVVTGVRARADRDDDELLLTRLPRTPRVLDVRAHCLLHTYVGGAASPLTKSTVLSDEQVAALTPQPLALHEPARPPRVHLDGGDRRLVAVLARDARASVPELATATGWSPSTVRRRLEQLRVSGAVYFDVDVDARTIGYGAVALLWLTVAPAQVAEVGAALAAHPEVAFATAVTGEIQLHAVAVCQDVPELYRYLTGEVAALPAVAAVETQPVLRTLKGSGASRRFTSV